MVISQKTHFNLIRMKKLRIAILFTGGGSSGVFLSEKDPNCDKNYEFVCAVSSAEGASGISYFQKIGIPCIVKDWKKFRTDLSSKEKRAQYFFGIETILDTYQVDLVLLAGFMLIIPNSFIDTYHKKIVNVHPADLRILGDDKKPKYRGDNAVVGAFMDGQSEFCSTIHYVDPGDYDCGEIICVSDPYKPGDVNDPVLIQGNMKTLCDGPAYQKALEILCCK